MSVRLTVLACLLGAALWSHARAEKTASPIAAFPEQGVSSSNLPLRDAVLQLPANQRAQLREALCRAAELELDRRHRQEASSDLFAVVTDLPGRGQAERLVANLNAARASVARSLGTTQTPRLPDEPVRVYVLANARAYQRLLSRAQQLSWSAGFYHPSGFIALNGQWPSLDLVNSYLIHEATHALIDRLVRKVGVAMPRWLEEGYADFIGRADLVRGEVRPGRHRERWAGRTFVPRLGRFVLIPSAARLNATRLKGDLRSGRALSLRELFDLDSPSFYGAERTHYYTHSWMAVEFLHRGREGWDTSAFPQFFRAVADGVPLQAAFETAYRVAPDALDEAFHRFAIEF